MSGLKSGSFRLVGPGLKRYISSYLEKSNVTRITVPQRMVKKIETIKTQKILLSAATKRPLRFKSPLIISCKRNEFNHHRGQTYSEFSPQMLASHGWKHYKSVGDHFTLVCHDKNPALIDEQTDHTRFTDFDFHDGIQKGLQEMGFVVPTQIQSLAIPKLLQGHDVLCAAETGSGKTLAYLLPIAESIHRQKEVTGKSSPINSPSAIVLIPSRELADQIMSVAEKLAAFTDLLPHSVCGGRGTKQKLAWPQKKPMDLLICTPGILRKLVSAGHISSSHLQHIVVDEADTLLDDSFSGEVRYILQKLKVSGGVQVEGDPVFRNNVQFVLVSATIARNVEQIIGDFIPVESLKKVTTKHLHRIMPHVPQKFLRIKPTQKLETVIPLAKRSHRQHIPTIIFCNKSSTCFWLSETLTENNIPNVLMNGVIQEKRRSKLYEKFQNGESDILVATDIASRGLDTQMVHHVINYDFPAFMSDYVHRAGRVGRISSKNNGLVTSFVSLKWEVDLLCNIEMAARKATELYSVNANIKRQLEGISLNKSQPQK